MLVREAGWIHMYCETVQEILDTVIMAFKLSEHPEVLLPVNVNHDGNFITPKVSASQSEGYGNQEIIKRGEKGRP
jgi:pyruvate ferredoxin oxidoreductase alpha subunit/phenylglyoxylate dehydrogenase alpha subunit